MGHSELSGAILDQLRSTSVLQNTKGNGAIINDWARVDWWTADTFFHF